MRFADREDAGRLLAERLQKLDLKDPVVLALPRGGVPVGLEISLALRAPLAVLLVRKLGAPWNPELAMGAIVDTGEIDCLVDEKVARLFDVPETYVEEEVARETRELERRRAIYQCKREPVRLSGRTAIVVDDGIATGTTMRVALRAVRHQRPARVILAVPVAATDALSRLCISADQIICLEPAAHLDAISRFYGDFHQLDDAEVLRCLDRAQDALRPAEAVSHP